ncbi:hypothetical protein Sjap_021464 [Stephania japonica]|uniref:Lipoyl-binding domain-containing protein n=1 Tax=Stephania japonica TaxID=461633 RepID=A0AAP0HSV9_9MAGN
MADLEGQDHGPSSSNVGDNDDDFIMCSKEASIRLWRLLRWHNKVLLLMLKCKGNYARWFKKEGAKVSPGDVLCEIKIDKATVEMECMEEGFLAKIIHGDGAKEIKVGEFQLFAVKVLMEKIAWRDHRILENLRLEVIELKYNIKDMNHD